MRSKLIAGLFSAMTIAGAVHSNTADNLLSQNLACDFAPCPPKGLMLEDNPMVYIGHFSPHVKENGLPTLGFHTEIEESDGLLVAEPPHIVKSRLAKQLAGASPNISVQATEQMSGKSKAATYLACLANHPY